MPIELVLEESGGELVDGELLGGEELDELPISLLLLDDGEVSLDDEVSDASAARIDDWRLQ